MKLTKDKRLTIPQALIKKMGLKAGDNAYFLPIVKPDGVEILTYKVFKFQSVLKVNADGRLRISSRILEACGTEGDDFNVALTGNRNSIIITKS